MYSGIHRFLILFLPALTLSAGLLIAGFFLPSHSGTPSCSPNQARAALYIGSNGYHSSFILPVDNGIYDWKNDFRLPVDARYIEFGWGNRAFYMRRDFSLVTTAKALFPSQTVMHVVLMNKEPEKWFRKSANESIEVCRDDYQEIVAYIKDTFGKNARGNYIYLGKGLYGPSAFYEARGDYHTFMTCNTWVAEGLRKAHEPTPLWAGTTQSILWHLRNSKNQGTNTHNYFFNIYSDMTKTFGIIAGLLLVAGSTFLILKTVVAGSPEKRTIPPPTLPVSPGRLQEDVKRLCSTSGSRHFENVAALNEAAEYIKTEFRKAGFTPEEQKFKVEGNEYKNILCSYGPPVAERIVLGAHYDVCGEQPGADDNASGVAGLLEVARLLDSLKPATKYRIDLVAYTLEEPPNFRTANMGSAVHADYIIKNKIPFKAMICLEMIGYFTDKPGSQDYPVGALKTVYPRTGNFIAVVGRIGQGGLVKEIRQKMTDGSSINVESINAPAWMTGIDFSDHLNYWKYDLHAVMITNTSFYRNKNYHMPSDTPESLDYVRMAEVVKGVYWTITNMK